MVPFPHIVLVYTYLVDVYVTRFAEMLQEGVQIRCNVQRPPIDLDRVNRRGLAPCVGESSVRRSFVYTGRVHLVYWQSLRTCRLANLQQAKFLAVCVQWAVLRGVKRAVLREIGLPSRAEVACCLSVKTRDVIEAMSRVRLPAQHGCTGQNYAAEIGWLYLNVKLRRG